MFSFFHIMVQSVRLQHALSVESKALGLKPRGSRVLGKSETVSSWLYQWKVYFVAGDVKT